MGKSQFFPPYGEAVIRVRKKEIKTPEEYKLYYEELGLPKNPNRTYRGKGWIKWAYFLGTSPTFEEAKKLIKENGIKTKSEYVSRHKALGLPADPRTFYKDEGWTNWVDYLGNERAQEYTLEELHRIVRENGIKSKGDYKASYKALGLPSAPDRVYKDKGWKGWSVLLCKPIKVSPEKRNTRVLTKLFINPVLLETAPLQVLYMLTTLLDKGLAKGIENLLGTTSFEERLNWVKEQLKTLKDSTPTKSEQSGESSVVDDEEFSFDDLFKVESVWDEDSWEAPDELSAMESVFEEFDDITETLSENTRIRIQTIMENYQHSVANRELIAEYDG